VSTAIVAVLLLSGLPAATGALHSPWNSHGSGARASSALVYPSAPALAPDRLPFGPVGPVGAVGPQGAGAFSAGTPSIVGVSPCGTAGCTTVINADTTWANETLSILGNVSVDGPYRLTLYDSSLTFAEPSMAVGYAYGINVSASGGAAFLDASHGTVIKQTGTEAFWIESATGVGGRAQLDLSNATLLLTGSSASPPAGFYGNDLFLAGNLTHSTFRGANQTTFGIAPLPTVGQIWSGDVLEDGSGTLLAIANSTMVHFTPVFDLSPVSYVTISQMNTSFMPSFDGGLSTVVLAHDLFESGNWSYQATGAAFFGAYPNGGTTIAENDTWLDLRVGFTRDIAGTPPDIYLLGDVTTRLANLVVDHDAVENLTYLGGNVDLFGIAGNAGNVSFDYNLLEHDGSTAAYGDGGLSATNLNANNLSVVGNLIEGQYDVHGPVNVTDQGWSVVDGHAIAEFASLPVHGTWSQNFAVNTSGNVCILAPYGIFGSVTANTFVGLDGSTAINVADSAERDMTTSGEVYGNAFYGVTNGSAPIASLENGFSGVTIGPNTAAGEDSTSRDALLALGHATLAGDLGTVTLTGGLLSAGTEQYRARSSFAFSGANVGAVDLQALSNIASYRAVTAQDFNLTVASSYVPCSLLSRAQSFAVAPAGHPNADFLNLTGFLGVFAGQSCTVNTTDVRGASALPVEYSGSIVTSLPTIGGHVYSVDVVSPSAIDVGADAVTAPAISVVFSGLYAGSTYEITATSAAGPVFLHVNETATAGGTVAAVYSPSADPLNSTFTVECLGVCAPLSVPNPATGIVGDSFLGVPLVTWMLLAVLVVIAAAVVALGSRRLRV
jgi:hypothetical protein